MSYYQNQQSFNNSSGPPSNRTGQGGGGEQYQQGQGSQQYGYPQNNNNVSPYNQPQQVAQQCQQQNDYSKYQFLPYGAQYYAQYPPPPPPNNQGFYNVYQHQQFVPPVPAPVPPPPLPKVKCEIKEEREARNKPCDAIPSSSKVKQEKDIEEEVEVKETKKPVPIMVGKRRGGRSLPTGVVKKQRPDSPQQGKRTDAWSQYMNEVKRYKERSCEDDGKNRPLVK